MKNYDLLIIGGGPAGSSAALYGARGGLKVCVLHNGVSALHRAERIENFYGSGAVSGDELYARGLEQARAVGADIIETVVTFASFTDKFEVDTTDGKFTGKALLLATGASRKQADIDGIDAVGVSYCAVCDGFFYRKKKVGVIGAGEFAAHEYAALEHIAGEVVLFTNGESTAISAPTVYAQKIKRIEKNGDGRVCGVTLDDGETVSVDGLFVAIGVCGSSAIAKSMGILTLPDGSIKTDALGRTNIPGLYAAGDCTSGIKQVAKAACDGMNAAFDIIKTLRNGG